MAAKKISELSVLPEIDSSDLLLVSSGTSSRSTTHAGLFANVNAPVVFNDTITFSNTSTFIDANAQDASDINAISLTVSDLSTLNTANITTLNVSGNTTLATANIATLNVNGVDFDSAITGLESADTTFRSDFDAANTRIGVNETDIGNLDDRVVVNETDIGNLESADTTFRSDFDAANTRIGTNENDITALESADTTFRSDFTAANTRVGALESADTTFRSDFDAANTRVGISEGNITTLGEVVGINGNNIAALDDRLDVVEPKVNALESADAVFNVRVGTNANNITALETDSTSIRSDFDAANTRVGNLEGADTTFRSDFDAANTRIGVNETDIGNLESADTTFRSDFDSANTRVGNLETASDSIRSDFDSANTRVGNLETASDSIRSDFDSANTRVGNLEDADTTFRSDFDAANTRVGNLESADTTFRSDFDAANTRIGDNETDITALEMANNSLNTDFANGTSGTFKFRGTEISTGSANGTGLDTIAGDARYANLATFTSANTNLFDDFAAGTGGSFTFRGQTITTGTIAGGTGLSVGVGDSRYANLANFNSANTRVTALEAIPSLTGNVTALESANTNLDSNFANGTSGTFKFRGTTITTGSDLANITDLTVPGDLTVSGNTALANTTSVTDLDVGDVLRVIGGTVMAAASFSGGIDVTGGGALIRMGDLDVQNGITTLGAVNVTTLNVNGTSYDSAITGLEDADTAIRSDFTAANTRVGTLETDSTSIRSDFDAANTRVGNLETASDSIRSDFDSANTNLSTDFANGTSGTFKFRGTEISTGATGGTGLDTTAGDERYANLATFTFANTRVTALESADTVFRSDFDAANTRVGINEGDITALEMANTIIYSTVSDLSGNVISLETSPLLASNVTAVESANTNLSGDFADGSGGNFTFRGATIDTGAGGGGLTTGIGDARYANLATFTSANNNLVSDFASGDSGDFTFRGTTITTGGRLVDSANGSDTLISVYGADSATANTPNNFGTFNQIRAFVGTEFGSQERLRIDESGFAVRNSATPGEAIFSVDVGNKFATFSDDTALRFRNGTGVVVSSPQLGQILIDTSQVITLDTRFIILDGRDTTDIISPEVSILANTSTDITSPEVNLTGTLNVTGASTLGTANIATLLLDGVEFDPSDVTALDTANTNLVSDFINGTGGTFTFRGNTISTGASAGSGGGFDTANADLRYANLATFTSANTRVTALEAIPSLTSNVTALEASNTVLASDFTDGTGGSFTFRGNTITTGTGVVDSANGSDTFLSVYGANTPNAIEPDSDGSYDQMRFFVGTTSGSQERLRIDESGVRVIGADTIIDNGRKLQFDNSGGIAMGATDTGQLTIDTNLAIVLDSQNLELNALRTTIDASLFTTITSPAINLTGALTVTGASTLDAVSIDGVLQIAPADGAAAKRYDVAVVANTTGAVFLTAVNSSGTNFHTQLTEGAIPA